jgi:putative membrane protein
MRPAAMMNNFLTESPRIHFVRLRGDIIFITRAKKGLKMKCKSILGGIAVAAAAFSISTVAVHTSARADQNDPTADQQKMEKEFFKMNASDNTLEIRLAKLVEERVSDPQVKQMAQMMEQDHTQANQLLKQIADQHHIDVSTDDLNSIDSAEYKMLDEKQGDVFTHMYVFSQVGDHARDELILAFHSNHGGDACREYSTQILPKVQEHLRMLEQIARPMAGLSGDAVPAASQMPAGH